MNEAEFKEKINAADLELAAQGIPVHQRIFRAFNFIAPNYNGILLGFLAGQSQFSKYEGPRLLNEIEEWYQKIHGERSGLGEPIGHVPVVLRSDIYIFALDAVGAQGIIQATQRAVSKCPSA